MENLYKKIIFLTRFGKYEEVDSETLRSCVEDLIRLKDELPLEVFYSIKMFLKYMLEKQGIKADELDSVEKEISTLDEIITKLQIPLMSFSNGNLFKQSLSYTRESELYDDIRKVLLNKDGVRSAHKRDVHFYVLIVARLIKDEMEKYDLEESVELTQFKSLLMMAIKEFSKEIPDENGKEEKDYLEWMYNSPLRVEDVIMNVRMAR